MSKEQQEIAGYIDILKERFQARVFSVPPYQPLPHDVDIFIEAKFKSSLLYYLEHEGFVCTEHDFGCVARRFQNGECYYFDIGFHLFSSIPILRTSTACDVAYNVNDSDFGTLELLLRYIFNFRSDGYANSFVQKNFLIHQSQLRDILSRVELWMKPNVSIGQVHKMMLRQPLGVFEVFTFKSAIRILYTHYLIKFKNLCSGKIIAVVGPDGSGKTTVIHGAKRALFAEVVYMGDWGFKLQSFYNFLHSKHIAIARMSYVFMYVENWLRFLRVYYLKCKGRIILIDRYPGYNRHLRRTNIWLIANNLLYFMFPDPDLFIFVSAPPELIYERKQELSIEEILKTQENMRIKLKEKKYLEVENVDLDACLSDVVGAILKK